MQHIGQLLTGVSHPAPNPDRTKVRRSSRMAGRCEATFWRPVKRQEARQIVLAARRYEISTKQKGKRNGALGHVALEILDYLTNLVDYRTGRLEPSLDYLMEKLCRSRDAIVRALKALRTHGFIDWLRRFVPTGNEGHGQPKYQQTSNAYRLSMPKRALRYLGRYGKKAPLPDDFTHAQETQAATIEAYKDSLSLSEQALFELGDTPLGQTLARLGKMMENRESAKRSESLSKDSFIEQRDRLSPDIE